MKCKEIFRDGYVKDVLQTNISFLFFRHPFGNFIGKVADLYRLVAHTVLFSGRMQKTKFSNS